MVTQKELDEAILDIMGRPDWDIIAQYLYLEAARARDACADADSWDDVLKMRGFSEGLAYVINLRESTKRALEEETRADL